MTKPCRQARARGISAGVTDIAFRAVLSLGLTLVVLGCSQTTYSPVKDHQVLDETDFVHYLSQQPMVTYDELCRATLIVADGEDTQQTFVERVSELKSRGIVRPEWDYSSDFVVDHGKLAYMILQMANVPKGVNSTLADYTGIGCERYALWDVVRQDIVMRAASYRIPTGGQVTRALANADDFMAKHGMYETAEREINSPADVQ